MLTRLSSSQHLLILVGLFAFPSLAIAATPLEGKCPPKVPGDIQVELVRAIDNLTSPNDFKCKASQGKPDDGWDRFIDPTFKAWKGPGGSHNLPVVTAAVGLYRFPNAVMRKSPADYQITWVQWWVVFLASQTGESVPAGYPAPPPDRPHLFRYKGTEAFSNIYDAAVVSTVVTVRYWAYLNGHDVLIRLTQKYLRANWALYAMAAGPTPVWRYELGPQLLPNGTTTSIRTPFCHPSFHLNGNQYDECAPTRPTGGYQYNGRFIALAGSRSKLVGHWAGDDKGPLFDRAIEMVPNPLQSYELNEPQGVILNKLENKWPELQWRAPQPPPVDENLYGLTRGTDLQKIKSLMQPSGPNDVTSSITYLMPWLTWVRMSTTHRILGWQGWRVSLMETNTNGNTPNMYAIAYQNPDSDATHVKATFLHPWTDANSGGSTGWCRLEAPGSNGMARIHASNRNIEPQPTPPPGQKFREEVMYVPGSQPLFHVVLTPGNAPYLETTPPAGWPPTPKLSPPPFFTAEDDHTSWVFNEVPEGAITGGVGEDWNWIDLNPSPVSEAFAVHESNLLSGLHQHYFYNATNTIRINPGDKLTALVYPDPTNPPTEIMLQWYEPATGFEHRAFWGQNQIGWGTTGTNSRRYMGPLPPAGEWTLLEVPASMVGAEGLTLSGMAFTLFNGKATWDDAGRVGQGGPSVNLALNKSATQSTTYASAPASRAVDGNTNGNFFGNSVSHTDNNAQAWWQVDLGGVYPINNINLWNRTDCCPERFSNFYVLVSNDPFTSTNLSATLNQPGVSSYYVPESAVSPTMVAVLRTGRYVRVQLVGSNYLSIAEVEVLGPPEMPQPPPPQPSINVLWVKPAELSWGDPHTLTVAGFAQNGSGTVQLVWRDETNGTTFTAAPIQPVPAPDGSWSNTIPSPDRCHTFRVYANYSGVRSADFVYNGATAGYCNETVNITAIQPQWMAQYGPPGSLVVAGTAAPAGYGVVMSYRDVTAGTNWVTVPWAPPPDANGNWFNAIENANFFHQYQVQVKYDIRTSSVCLYQGTNSFSSCPQ
jgi:hypothetical protein